MFTPNSPESVSGVRRMFAAGKQPDGTNEIDPALSPRLDHHAVNKIEGMDANTEQVAMNKRLLQLIGVTEAAGELLDLPAIAGSLGSSVSEVGRSTQPAIYRYVFSSVCAARPVGNVTWRAVDR